MSREAALRTVRTNCVGGVVFVLTWAFFLNKDWPTAFVTGATWVAVATLVQVLIAWAAKRKRKHTAPQ